MMHRLAAALMLICLAAPLRAETLRALLVGVGAYAHLPGADLKGPENDVRLMAEVLLARGADPAAITVLTTDPTGLPAGVATGAPTRDAILAGLDALAVASGPGDLAFFHFSGHGSQAPDRDGDEMGGYDEILLPMDAAGWKGAIGAVENAILDDELQPRMQAILDRGARLVGVIDACHSATGFRAVGGAGVARTLTPAQLGIPDDAPVAAATAPRPPVTGEFVFLYAAQSDQRAFEYPLAEGQGWYGAFTRQLAAVLLAAPQATWGQVLAEVRDTMQRGSAVQTADGEGPMLDAPVFGAGVDTGAGARRIGFAEGRLQAGLLWGLTEGTEVALYPSATADTPVARARLARLTATTAALVAEPGQTLPQAGQAEVTAPAPPPPLRLRPMEPDGAGDWPDLLAAAVEAGLADWALAEADLVPVALPGGGLAFAGSDGVLDAAGPGASPRVDPGPGAADRLAVLLADAGHALRLRALLGSAQGGARGFAIGGPPVALSVERRPGAPGPQGCGPATGAPAPADPAKGVAACDELWLTLSNRSGRAQDVTLFYLDRDWRLAVLWPQGGLSNRIARGESARIGLRVEAPGGRAAAEEILAVAVAADDNAPRTDLSHLAEPGASRAAGPADGLADGLAAALDRLMDPDAADRTLATPKLTPFTVLRQPVRLLAPARP